MAVRSDALADAQQVAVEAGAAVAPRLADFDHPLFAIHVDGDFTVRIAQAHGGDGAGEFEFLVAGPAPAVVGGDVLREQQRGGE